MKYRSLVFVAAALALQTVACGSSAVVSSELPVRQVVVYRNGVAYFEREGTVRKDNVRFKMRDSEVSDFLGTLAVVEKDGSSVRAASFPIRFDDAPIDPKDKKAEKKRYDERKALRDVVLRLDGKKHELRVGYVAPSPVWRPSYRLLVNEGASEAQLQAWGVVENVSGEDWSDIKLTLVAGAPLAFESQLGTPTIPQRPRVTDQGEVMAIVPRSETSYAERSPSGAAAPEPAPAVEESYDSAADDLWEGEAATASREQARRPGRAAPSSKLAGAGAGGGGYGSGVGSQNKASFAPPAAPSPSVLPQTSISQPRDLSGLAAIAQEGGTTRYALPHAVTVPNMSATMVLLAAQPVSGEISYLYSRDSGVADSMHHPFRVARFKNGTGGALERGPIAVFEGPSFVGQGMVDPLPIAGTTTVPFALERGLAIESSSKTDVQGARVASIQHGQLYIERDRVQLTTYKIKNGLDRLAKVLIKHPRGGDARLHEPPTGTEDNPNQQSALVPLEVKATSDGSVTIDERSAFVSYENWFSPLADTALKDYAASKNADRNVVAQLDAVATLRGEIRAGQDALSKIDSESNGLQQQAEETRSNLRAIEKNNQAAQLRAQLTARLTQTSSRLDTLTKERITLSTKLTEQSIRFRDAVQKINLPRK